MAGCDNHVYETAERREGYEMTYCGQNIRYQTDIGRSAPELDFRAFPQTPHSSSQNMKEMPRWWLFTAAITVIIIIIGLLVALLVQLSVSPVPAKNGFVGEDQNITEITNTSISISDAQSCLDIRNLGIADDGIYKLKPDENFSPSQTYCDMSTDGGGWTLVASIHENDIKRKCYPDDLWSVHQTTPDDNFAGKSNWENKMTFGNVQRSTSADFKHAGFFSMNASDVMVWHVPNDVAASAWKERSTLRYRTNKKFLQSNGGNIGAIYRNKFSLTVSSEYKFTKAVLDALASNGEDVTGIFPNFHTYAYSQTTSYLNVIPDLNMYRSSYYGNRISFYDAICYFSQVEYGEDHKCPGSFWLTSFGTRKSKPFYAATAILNVNRASPLYYFEVRSYRPYSYPNDETVIQNAAMIKGNLKLRYEMVQYRNSTYVTIGEFYFVVSNERDWGSVEPSRFYRSYKSNSGYFRYSEYRVEGHPANIIFGYTLLAVSYGGVITQDQANKVGEEILNAIAPLTNLFLGIDPQGLYTPVVYDKGSNEEVMSMIPPVMRPFVQPGFLQFRAYNISGYPSAFCPGIKVLSIHPEFACVGSISNSVDDHSTCGDFAGWEGLTSNVVQSNDAIGLAHSYRDIFSTILIFQR